MLPIVDGRFLVGRIESQGLSSTIAVYALADRAYRILPAVGTPLAGWTGLMVLPDGRTILGVRNDVLMSVDMESGATRNGDRLPMDGVALAVGPAGKTMYVLRKETTANIWMLTIAPDRTR